MWMAVTSHSHSRITGPESCPWWDWDLCPLWAEPRNRWLELIASSSSSSHDGTDVTAFPLAVRCRYQYLAWETAAMLSVTWVDLVHVVGQQQPGNINQLGRAYATLGKIARGNFSSTNTSSQWKMNSFHFVCKHFLICWGKVVHIATFVSMLLSNSFPWSSKADAFTALTLLVGHQEEHSACKKFSDEVLAWFDICQDIGVKTQDV